MKKIILIFGLLIMNLCLISQTSLELEWKYSDPQIISGSPDKLSFKVEIKPEATSTFVMAGLAFDFNQNAFGSNPTFTIVKGSTFSTFTGTPNAGIGGTIQYELADFTFTGVSIPSDSYTEFCTVTINIDDNCSAAGIDFNETLMDGASFYNPGFATYENQYTNDLLDFVIYTPISTTWTGTLDSDWDNPGNWTDCVPGAASNVIIGASANPAETNGAVTINDLTIEVGGEVTATAGTFGVDGDLLIKSDPSGTGSLIQDGALNGTIQRHLKGWGSYSTELKNGHGWHLLSSPVAAQAIAPFQNLLDNDDFMKWNEVQNYWDNRRVGVSGLNGSFDTQFGIGTGYLVAYEDDKDFAFGGVLNTADVAVAGLTNSYTAGSVKYYGHHLLGNPFSSALAWNNGDWNLSNVASHIQIWHEADASYSVLDPGDPIPAMQGFFVYTSGGGSLNIPASKRVHSAVPYYKDAPQQILLTAHDLDHQMKQESKIRFNENATEGFDLQYDSYFMGGYAPRFYSVSQGAAYALNTLPAMTEELVIPFTFVKNEGTNFEITLDAALDYGTIYLTDNKTNVTVNLSQTGSYSFVAADGDDVNRFLLKFGAVGIDDPAAAETSIEIYTAGDALYFNAKQPGNATVSVYDLLGRTVLTTEVHMSPSASVDVSRLSGTFIVRAIANGEVVSAKVFIK